MTIKRLTKVWPLKAGTQGYTASQEPTQLQPGVPGFMDWGDAVAAEQEGLVDIMMGKTPQSLRKPVYETRVVTATPDPEPVPSAVEEEKDEDLPKPEATKKARPRPGGPRRKYRRTDMTAEN